MLKINLNIGQQDSAIRRLCLLIASAMAPQCSPVGYEFTKNLIKKIILKIRISGERRIQK